MLSTIKPDKNNDPVKLISTILFSGIAVWRKRLVLSILLSFLSVSLILVTLYGAKLNLTNVFYIYIPLTTLLLATIALIFNGAGFFRRAFNDLKRRQLSSNTITVLGVITLYSYSLSIYITNYLSGSFSLKFDAIKMSSLYFCLIILILFLATISKYIEASYKSKNKKSINALTASIPSVSHLLVGSYISDIPTRQIKLKDKLLIKPKEVIPVDGIVTNGNTVVNESALTGESINVDKHVGDSVTGGTLNGHGLIEIQVTRIGRDTTLAQIISTTNKAKLEKLPIDKLSNQIAAVLVPLILVISVASFLICFFYLKKQLDYSLAVAIAVVTVALPYTFSLASTSANWFGLWRAKRKNIVIKDANILQTLSRVNAIVFDKTGTLTVGKPEITDIIPIDKSFSKKEILQIAYSLENKVEHNFARAVIKKARKAKLKLLNTTDFSNIPGYGVTGMVEGGKYYLGNNKLFEKYFKSKSKSKLPSEFAKLEKAGKSISYLFKDSNIIAVIAIADQPKKTSAKAIKLLNKLGIETYILSGDNQITVQAIARRLGIKNVVSEMLPDEKFKYINKLRRSGHVVAMVGDGNNDAPAIATADVGISLGQISDVTTTTSDVSLLSDDPTNVCYVIKLAMETVSKIKQNVFFALFYSLISVSLLLSHVLLSSGNYYMSLSWLTPPIMIGVVMLITFCAMFINCLSLQSTHEKHFNLAGFLLPIVVWAFASAVYIKLIF